MIKTTIYNDEQELLKDIISLHCKTDIELDPMFFKGNFYKDIPEPVYKFDINPQIEGVVKADACNLPLEDKSITTMVLDPPFMFGNHGKQKQYYSSKTHGIIPSFESLQVLYKSILVEAYRVMKRGGTLIFKCQDFTDSKTTLVHCYVFNWALEIGFKVKDLAILNLPKNKIWNSQLKQRHLRKVHSYFYVFKK